MMPTDARSHGKVLSCFRAQRGQRARVTEVWNGAGPPKAVVVLDRSSTCPGSMGPAHWSQKAYIIAGSAVTRRWVVHPGHRMTSTAGSPSALSGDVAGRKAANVSPLAGDRPHA